jgi:uncharacterized membrane protein
MRSRWLAPVIAALLLAFGIAVSPHLSPHLASHWDLNGHVNGTMPKLTAVLLGPAIVLALWLLALALPRIDPLGAAYVEFRPTYWLIMNTIEVYLAAVFVLMLGRGLGWNVDMARLVPAGVGLLFAVLGNEMGRLQPNWFIGVRTPWTLASPDVWRATHRLAGRVFVAVGLAIAFAAFFVPTAALTYILLTGVAVAVAVPVVYSYLRWRSHPSVDGVAS